MKMKKFLAVCLSALTVTGMLAGCGGAKGGDTSSAGAEKEGSSAEGSVYYLNFKPEIADQWEEIAAKYTEETGVPVKVKVDDVISTGGSLKALDALAEKTQCTIVGQAAVLAEGDAAERKDIIFLEPLPLFFH